MENEIITEDFFEALKDFKGIGKEAKNIRPIVDIETWLNEEYYIGPDGMNIYPYWKEAIKEIYNSPEIINEVILGGAIGVGKTTIANYLIMRKIYELSCYYPIQALYNLMSTKKILIALFNINKEVAFQGAFGQLREMIDNTQYFRDVFKRKDNLNSALVWEKENLLVKYASSETDVIGLDLIACLLDEANFYHGDGAKGNSVNDVQSKAVKMYNSISSRGKSRFIVNGVDYTFRVLVSSSMYDSSFTADRIKKSIGDSHVKVFEPRLWDVKPDSTYSKERFLVFAGNELVDPMICNSVNDVNTIRESYNLPRTQCDNVFEAIKDILDYDIKKKFISVPMNFKSNFEGNMISALQDIAGVPVGGVGKLFSNREAYSKALNDDESPFIQDEFIISTGAATTIQDYIKKDWKPKDLGKKRFMHLDQSLSGDSYGLACSYVDSIEYDGSIPLINVKIEWMLRINPPKPPHQIDLARVRSIIPYLSKTYGIKFGKITYDTFQSSEAVQDLRKSGFNVAYRSVEKDTSYLTLCDLYYQGRINHYRNTWYEKELFELVWLRTQHKVDHPPKQSGGSKDLSDAVCGSVMNVLESDEITNVRRSSDLFNVINAEKHQTYSNRDDLLKSVESALLSNH